MALISLVYISYASKKMTDDDLKAILKTARDFNQPKNITGMLLYRDGFFIQALEGEEDEVMPLYNKIKLDERHKNIVQLSKTEIEKRSFEDWAMGYNVITDDDLKNMEGFTDFLTKPMDMAFFTKDPSTARQLLYGFSARSRF